MADILSFPAQDFILVNNEQAATLLKNTGLTVDQWNDLSISVEHPDAVRYVPIWDED